MRRRKRKRRERGGGGSGGGGGGPPPAHSSYRQDLAKVKEEKDSNIVLLDLPKVLFVEMLTPMKKQYEGLGTNVFPMRPLQTCWHLDRECTVEIWRKGFPWRRTSAPRSTQQPGNRCTQLSPIWG